MRFKGVAGASKSQVGVDTVVFGLLGETPKARTFSEIMVAQCKSFGMKPVCQVPAYCQKDARSLYLGSGDKFDTYANSPVGFSVISYKFLNTASYNDASGFQAGDDTRGLARYNALPFVPLEGREVNPL